MAWRGLKTLLNGFSQCEICGGAMVRGVPMFSGFHPRHPRTRITTYPQWQHGYYVAPHKDHTSIVVMLHRTILPALFKHPAQYVAPHKDHVGIVVMLHRTIVAPHHIGYVAPHHCCTAPLLHRTILVMLHRTIVAMLHRTIHSAL
jgi:hypothetical protein